MKKTISLGIVAAAIMLAGCSKSTSSGAPGDDVIRQKIVGTWKIDADPTGKETCTFNADGTFEAKGGPGEQSQQMKWQVANGLLVVSGTDPTGSAHTETNKVVSIDDHQWVLQESLMNTNLITFTKQ